MVTRTGWIRPMATLAIALLLLLHWGAAGQPPPADLAGLASTSPLDAAQAFQLPAGDLPFSEVVRFQRGKDLFHRRWPDAVVRGSPVPLAARNAVSCAQCHIRGGRGALMPLGSVVSPLAPFVPFRRVAGVGTEASLPSSRSLQDISGPSGQNVGEFVISWAEHAVTPGWRIRTTLVRPALEDRRGGIAEAHLRASPPMIGGALIEAIADDDIVRWQSERRMGRVRYVTADGTGDDVPRSGVGRFGHQAERRTVRDVVLNALRNELGLSVQHAMSERDLADLEFYSGEVGVPGRPPSQAAGADAGFHVFDRIGCASCHRPSYTIQRQVRSKTHSLRIWPFSDFLLHDLGPDMTDGGGTKAEWRTTPLWGLGRARVVLGFDAYLHDGRARSLDEAIVWHGGDALPSRDRYMSLHPAERDALHAFLRSL